MKYEDAEKLVEQLNREVPSWWCPISKETCKSNCLCFRKASIIHDPMDKFAIDVEIHRPRCVCPTLTA